MAWERIRTASDTKAFCCLTTGFSCGASASCVYHPEEIERRWRSAARQPLAYVPASCVSARHGRSNVMGYFPLERHGLLPKHAPLHDRFCGKSVLGDFFFANGNISLRSMRFLIQKHSHSGYTACSVFYVGTGVYAYGSSAKPKRALETRNMGERANEGEGRAND